MSRSRSSIGMLYLEAFVANIKFRLQLPRVSVTLIVKLIEQVDLYYNYTSLFKLLLGYLTSHLTFRP